MNLAPAVLSGRLITLEPLHERHSEDLLTAAGHDEIWAFLDMAPPRSLADINAIILEAHDDQSEGRRRAFAIIDIASGLAIGSTSYLNIRAHDRSLEIGLTWLRPASWRTGVNLETKYLLLRHAFEDWGTIRVGIKADVRNMRSRLAIESLGASREGILRHDRILKTGIYRDTIYYSIIRPEWPTVRVWLEAKLANNATSARQ